MPIHRCCKPSLSLLVALLWPLPLPAAVEWQLSVESRWFARSNLQGQRNNDNTIGLQARHISRWNQGDDEFVVIPKLRINDRDSEQNRFDFESLSWNHRHGDWSIRSGIRTVTWQVVESNHLVDVINQIDASADIDAEDKLGELMINVLRFTDWGSVEWLVMPGFRERVLPGPTGRLRPALPYDTDTANYESAAEALRTDVAFRINWIPGAWELAVSHFSGTSREPRFSLVDGKLRPHYPVIDQTGLELQHASGNWLWKAEAISNSGVYRERYAAVVAGFEFTWSGLGATGYDIGALGELLWDERPDAPLAHDWFGGLRLGLNDIAGTELLVGAIADLHSEEYLGIIEGSRRFGSGLRLAIEARTFGKPGAAVDGDFGFLHREDYMQLTFDWFF